MNGGTPPAPDPGETVVGIEKLVVHRDQRGLVIEPLAADRLREQRNVHVVISAPGAVRGNHFHERGREVLTVFGPALVRLRAGEELTDTTVPADEVWRFTIPPGVSHAVRNIGSAPALLVAFNTEDHDPADADVIRDVILTG